LNKSLHFAADFGVRWQDAWRWRWMSVDTIQLAVKLSRIHPILEIQLSLPIFSSESLDRVLLSVNIFHNILLLHDINSISDVDKSRGFN
jgi:hypothetical protein